MQHDVCTGAAMMRLSCSAGNVCRQNGGKESYSIWAVYFSWALMVVIPIGMTVLGWLFIKEDMDKRRQVALLLPQ